MESNQNTPATKPPVKKRSAFKRAVVYTLVLGGLGGAGYLAYNAGAMDAYLPSLLKSPVATQPEAVPAPSGSTAQDNMIVSDAPTAAATPNLNQTKNTAPAPVVEPTPTAPAATVVAPTATPLAPITIAINGAPANAIFAAYDAQWQMQSIEQSFKAQGDVAATLQQTQALKAQIQANNSVSFAPSITALAQVEAQLQAWMPVQTAAYLSALQQTIVDVDGMTIQAAPTEDLMQASAGEQSWWQRVLASLKNIIQIKRIDEQKNTAALSASTAALVKQSISARLNSAQWAAQTGQWQQAQAHARAAQALAAEWADATALTKLKPLLDVASFPAQPDFATVNAALVQARAQLANEAHAAQALPAPNAVPNATPNLTAPATTPPAAAPAVKGGA